MLIRIANRGDLNQKQSDWVCPVCLKAFFWLATIVQILEHLP